MNIGLTLESFKHVKGTNLKFLPIYKCRNANKSPNIQNYKSEVIYVKTVEFNIAKCNDKNNKMLIHMEKWQRLTE